MNSGFWKKLAKPIFVSAPMANVTDLAFRRMLAKYGKPDVIWTEFVSCDGMTSRGKENIMIDLAYDKSERPIVAQIFGAKPENFYKTALMVQELGFDGIDINMGCPDRNVEKQGAGAALIKNPELAKQIIRETKRGAGKMAVSIKTRIGYSKNQLTEWLPSLLEEEPAAIIIHARTRREQSLVPARWEHLTEAVQIRDKYDDSKYKTLILGNGDVTSLEDGFKKIKETGADGVMVGRGLFGNPWFFAPLDSIRNCHFERSKAQREISFQPSNGQRSLTSFEMTIKTEDKLNALIEHTYLFEKLLGEHKSFDIMKKHFKAYVNGFKGAKELRVELMGAKDAGEVEGIVDKFLQDNASLPAYR